MGNNYEELSCREKDVYGREIVMRILELYTDNTYTFKGTEDEYDPTDLLFTATTINFISIPYTSEIKIRKEDRFFNTSFLEYSKFLNLKALADKGENVRYIMYWENYGILQIFNINEIDPIKYPVVKRPMRHDNWSNRKVMKEVIELPSGIAKEIRVKKD